MSWFVRRSISAGGAVCIAILLCASVAAADLVNVRASGSTPFAANCNGAAQSGTFYPNAEVEPYVSVNPQDQAHLVGVWQQDRWSNGGAQGLLTGVSRDGGNTWTRTYAHFTRCSGGNKRNGGDYERTSDPWVSFAPNGTVFQIALSFDDSDGNQAVLVSRSHDGGNAWSEPSVLQRDTTFEVGLDKESITADPNNSRFVYAVWDRLEGLTNPFVAANFRGPIWFSRTTNGGTSWEKARKIFDPGPDAQTIGSIIVVLPNGDLVNMFTLIEQAGSSNSPPLFVAIMRSTDRGEHWSKPQIVNALGTVFITDPETGEDIRTGDILPTIAVDPSSGALYIVWQDARFSGGKRDGLAFSRSTDAGRTWSRPVQINKAKSVQAFTASINVSQEGTIGVTYYDFRDDTPDRNTLLTSTWLLVSSDGGRTWRESRVAAPFDMRTAPYAAGYFVGDYEGLTGSLLPFFAKANSGNLANRTDIFAAPSNDEQGDTVGDNNNAQDGSGQKSTRERVKSHREVHSDR